MAQGDYTNDAAFRQRFQTWLAGIWAEKDSLIIRLRAEYC